ncbi:MAG: N-acetylmuramoyl-L-alanine amidase family protein [Lachnospiraceae bacterium]|nr:N-acetylmuramoyl-L-alanine amidase family protein [Lachnospiraceae bacterium]
MKKLLSFIFVLLMVMQITPLELFAANGETAITLIEIDLDSVVVGEKSPTSIYNSSNTYDITQVEWSCLYDNSFKAGDVFKEDSTYYLTFRVKAKAGYYLPVSEETGEYTGFYYINGDYNAKVCYTEDDEFVVRVKFVTNNIINNIYINLDYSKWTSFSVGESASTAQQQFFDSVYSIPEQYQNKYYIDEECCEILYENSTGVLNQLDYGHIIKNEYNYYMEYWVEALSRYDFDSDASNINVYINGVEVETKKLEYDSSWDAYVIDILIEKVENKSGWILENDNWYFYDSNGKKVTSWKRINNKWYYFNADGVMQSSKWINNKYYVKDNGVMAVSEFVDNGKYYVDENGIWLNSTKWLQIGEEWYYIKSGVVQKSKWLKILNKWYYFDSKGVMQSSKWINNKYYVKANGIMAVSEFVDNGKYYVDENGIWLNSTEWLQIDGKWYYLVSGMVQKSKWVSIEGDWYYFDANGIMQTSRWVNNKYYVKEDGKMAVSEWVDGGKYYVGADGVWVQNA